MHKQVYLAGLLVAASILACSLPAGGPTPDTPALPPDATLPTDTPLAAPDESPTEAPPEGPSILPAALYYLGNDSGGRLQIFRLDPGIAPNGPLYCGVVHDRKRLRTNLLPQMASKVAPLLLHTLSICSISYGRREEVSYCERIPYDREVACVNLCLLQASDGMLPSAHPNFLNQGPVKSRVHPMSIPENIMGPEVATASVLISKDDNF